MSKSVAKRVGERKEKLWALGLPIGVFIVFSIVWQLATMHSQSLVIPTFTETMAGLYRLVYVRGDLWMALYQSNQALVLGYLISVAIGLPLGLAMARAD